MNKKFTKLMAAFALLMFLIPLTGWGQTWEKTAPADLTTDDIIVVVDLTSGKAMSNNNGTSSAPSAIAVTLNTTNDQITSEVGETIQWTLITSGSGDSRTYQLANGTNYLYVTATNNGVRVGSGTRNTFTIVSGGENNGYYLYNVDGTDKRYVGCYSASDWRCYTTINNNIKINNIAFFKKITGGGGTNPEIQIAADELQLPWTANSDGYFNVTYTNDFEPFTAYAKLYNDAQGEEEFDGDWIELIEEDLSDLSLIEYGVQANTGTSVRTVYLYVEAMDESTNVIDAMFTITQAGVPTYTVTYDCNGGTSGCPDNVTGIASGTQIQLADAPSKDDYIFEGWSDGTNTYGENEDYTVTGDVTFTAQWSPDPSAPTYEWVLTPLASLTTDDVFVIVGNNAYAMSNDKGTSSAPSAVGVTVSNDDKITSEVTASIQWKISGNATDGYTFYPNGSTTTWLYCNTEAASSSNNNMRVGTGARKLFVKDNEGYLVTKDDKTDRYVSIYNNSDWRGYINTTTAPTTVTFYKRQVASNDPSISASNVNIAYDATVGSIAYTINNPVDGGTLAATTTADWITLPAAFPTPFEFSCTANTAAVARTATVTLTYTYGTPATSVTKDVTITQAGNPNVVDNISDITEVGTAYTVRGTVVATNARGFVIGDGTGYVYTYLNAAPTQSVGDMVKVSGTTGSYGQVIQFTSSATVTEATESNYNGDPQPTTITEVPDYSTGYHLSTYLEFEGTLTATVSGNYTNYDIAVGNSSIRIAYPTIDQITDLTALENKTVRVHGFFSGLASSGTVFTVTMESVEEVISTEPWIAVNTTTLNLPGTGGSGSLTLTYGNIDATTISTYWCDSEGAAADPYNWVNAGLDTSDDHLFVCMVGSNDGDARTAYFKVMAEDGNNVTVYSEIVTLTQAEYVPDYAFLPFQYTDEDVLTGLNNMPNGLTQSGLGTYSGSTPRLKFDTKDDELVLKLNGTPKAITFDIKGNSFSGGTFIVQLSEDGSTYEDLATYTELGGTTQTHTFLNTNDNVRYIKWVYTDRVNGNVALGNIYVDDEYLVRGNATVSEDLTLAACEIESEGKLTIESGATFEVTEPYALYNGGNSTNLVIKDGGQLKTPNAVYATVEKNIIGYTAANVNTNKGYYLISAPAEKYLYVAQDNEDVDAYHFDASYEGEEWRNFKGAQGAWNISASSAILYATKENSTLSLDGQGIVYNQPNPGANAVANKVPATTTNIDIEVRFNEGKAFQGWNLIGNPFTCTAYLVGHDFYRMNTAGDALIINTEEQGGGIAIDVCEGIFVQCTATGEVTFTTTEPNSSTGNNSMVNISVAQVVNSRDAQSSADYARIRINNGENLAKFVFNENTSRIYIPQGENDYAVVRSNGQGEMPVNFKAAENGTYTISINAENIEMDYMHLIDNMTGADIDLLATPSYTFEARTSDYASRFRLVFSANTAAENNDEPFAFFNGSEWVVNASENATLQVMDLMGRIVVSSNGASNVSTNGLTAGVYMLRLIDGENVKTQKIVVR